MLRKISILSLIAAFLMVSSCGKKDDDPFFWLLLGGDEATDTVTAPDQGETDVGETDGSDVTGEESTEVTVTVNDVTEVVDESKPFDMNTTKTVEVDLTVEDQNGPLSPVVIRITDTSGTTEDLLFQVVTDANGSGTGEFTIPSNLETVTIEITVGDTVLYTDTVDISNITGIIRVVTAEKKVETSGITDSDGDNVPDDNDEFPSDSTRSARILDFEDGQGTMAFEDQYPGKGDADFNDYVLAVESSRDMNAEGHVVSINARYQHIAKGAAFNHAFFLTVPGELPATVTVKRYDEDGNLKSEETYGSTSNIPVLPDSSTTIQQQNVTNEESFTPGHYSLVSIVFDMPADPSVIGAAPFDPYIYISRNKKEIHFPGKVFKNGVDQYLKSDGFPWAIVVPRAWNWPMERNHIDDRGANDGCYPDFDEWYDSHGTEYKDWYQNYDVNCVYPYIESSSGLMGFLKGGLGDNAVIIVTVLIGAAGLMTILLLRKKPA
jgi:LruC domain-containing protein